jgi:hypothetical protein
MATLTAGAAPGQGRLTTDPAKDKDMRAGINQ